MRRVGHRGEPNRSGEGDDGRLEPECPPSGNRANLTAILLDPVQVGPFPYPECPHLGPRFQVVPEVIRTPFQETSVDASGIAVISSDRFLDESAHN
jgi:hypothetical protein